MFRFTQKPSSGSYNQCLAKITNLVQLCMSVESEYAATTLTSVPTRTVEQDL